MDSGERDEVQGRPALRHWVFIGSVVALDFAFGLLAKSVFHASGISAFIRLEMTVPVMLWMLTRLIVDRFGTLTAYQMGWATLAIFAMPGAMLPGPYKLIPALLQGLLLDASFTAFRRLPRGRVFIAALAGGLLGNTMVMLLRVLWLGLPWSTVTKAIFGVQMATSLLVYGLAAALALVVWSRIKDLQITRMLRV